VIWDRIGLDWIGLDWIGGFSYSVLVPFFSGKAQKETLAEIHILLEFSLCLYIHFLRYIIIFSKTKSKSFEKNTSFTMQIIESFFLKLKNASCCNPLSSVSLCYKCWLRPEHGLY